MQEVINHLLTVGSGLAILGAGYLVWLMSGLVNVIFTPGNKWSWSKFFKGFVRAIIIALVIMSWVAVFDALDWFTTKMGADISGVLDGASISGLVGGIIGGTAYFLAKGYKNFYEFINPENTQVVVENPDYKGIGNDLKDIADALLPKWANEDKQTDEKAEKDAEKVKIGKGAADVNPLTRRLPDGTWAGQCSRYSYYLATGVELNYAGHPDYGPCNGRDMVNYLIDHCGYKSCGKIAGAIFASPVGEWGHTGMVIDPDNNIVNDSNYTPLTVSTHYLNLEAMNATYCCPPSMVPKPEPTPAPEPKPEPVKETFKVGDVVVPTKLVDYDGTRLIQWDPYYTISEISGNRAVLTAPRNGKPVVWAAMNTANITHAK